MICGKCGRELPGDTHFCPSCDGSDTAIRPNPWKADIMAVASLVLGILSLLGLNLLSGLLAVILGKIAKKECSKQGIATAGIVCGAIALVVGLFLAFIFRNVCPPGP